jgi:tRNA (guanosine-2'-O-)-methyltransferase
MALMGNYADQEFQSYLDTLTVDQKASLKPFLETYISESKRDQMQSVLEHRTRHVSVVLENVFQPHNAAAAIRSCECFGFQDLHVIELENDYVMNPDVTMGGCKWVSLHSYKNEPGGTGAVLCELKEKGYNIAATSLRPGCVELEALDLTEPIALCFGTEENGLSEEANELADVFVKIPSFGFTQSFNVSVSVALSLSSIRKRLEASDVDWRLSESEAEDLYLTWMMKTANRGLLLAKHFLDRGSSTD